MLTAAKEETFSAPMVWTDECVLPLAAAGVYPKTRVWGSKLENVHCSSATPPLRIELRWGCEESSSKTAVGSGVSFKYDPFGRRIYKSSSAGTSIFAYNYDNLIEETNASGSVVTRYTQGENIDEPLAMLRSSATSYYDADGIGSITSLSNGTGTISQTYGYDAFGKQTSSSGSLTNPFQFTGREFDSETSLYFNRARYYDPQTGRFLTEDPIGFDGGINFYAYVLNNPASFVDPFGLKLCKVFLPGLGNTYLDDSFYPRVKKWMDANDKAGIPIDFSQGFRTTEQQQALASDPAATTPAAAGNSLHEAGFAVDIRWSKVPKSQQGIVVQNATNAGLVWGGNFKHPKPDPVHFQRDPGNRKDRIKEAQDEYKKGAICECAK